MAGRRFQINLMKIGSFNPMILGSLGFKEHSQTIFKHLVDRWQRHLNEQFNDQRDFFEWLRRSTRYLEANKILGLYTVVNPSHLSSIL